MTEKILCVYCLEEKPKPTGVGEHIILAGLGGHATILDVCGGPKSCNQFFGDGIDRELLRHSRIALLRYFDPDVTDGQVGDKQFHPSDWGGFWDTKVLNDGDVPILGAPRIFRTDC